MKFNLRYVFSGVLVSVFFAFTVNSVLGQTATPTPTPGENKEEVQADLGAIQSKIAEYESKINELQSEAKSLSSQIQIVDSQIALTELRIEEAEAKIKALKEDIEVTEDKIYNLEGDIDGISRALLNRIVASYKYGKVEAWEVLLTSGNIDKFFTRLKYLKIVQVYDQKNILAAEQSKVSYANQQDILVEKEEEAEQLHIQLEGYNAQLESERVAKDQLLKETQGSEAVYQRLLAQARAEYASIQGIIAGKGVETKVGGVSEGERIASIIQGSSCNSSGTHVHFIVSSSGASQDPFNYLSSIDYTNNSGGDPFNPSGSWNWPIDATIKYNQGYGETWAVKNTWVGQVYRFHNGIDIGSTGSQTVRAVKGGALYQGSYSGNGGCRLQYVRVDHDEDDKDTFYLHVNY